MIMGAALVLLWALLCGTCTLVLQLRKSRMTGSKTEAAIISLDVKSDEFLPAGGFSALTRLGGGSYADVYQGSFDNKDVAIKHITVKPKQQNLLMETDQHAYQTRLVKREMRVLSRNKHPNVIKAIGVCQEEGKVCLILELVKHLGGGEWRMRTWHQHIARARLSRRERRHQSR